MKKIKAFTMVEILIISILISVGLFAVRKAIDHAKWTNMRVMQSVIANQLATEGIETVYQVRNTNFLEYYYSDLDQDPIRLNSCRLAYNYHDCYSTSKTCDSDGLDICTNTNRYIMQSGHYYITNSGGRNIIHNCICDVEHGDCDDIRNDKYAICLNDGARRPCPEGHEAGNDQSKYGKFYRMIKGVGVYNMGTNTIGGEYRNSSFCLADISAQEYRFCSIVAREGGQGGEVEICSTMTNFAEIDGEVVK